MEDAGTPMDDGDEEEESEYGAVLSKGLGLAVRRSVKS